MGFPEDTGIDLPDPFDLADALPAIAPGYSPAQHAKAAAKITADMTPPPGGQDAQPVGARTRFDARAFVANYWPHCRLPEGKRDCVEALVDLAYMKGNRAGFEEGHKSAMATYDRVLKESRP